MPAPARPIGASHTARRFLLVQLAALVLLGMQLAALLHTLDLDHHVHGEQCEVCLHLPAFGHGLPTSVALTLPLVPAPFHLADTPVEAPAVTTAHFHQRGPPQFL